MTKLPPNPNTITPPRVTMLTADGVFIKYRGRVLNATLKNELLADLAALRAWDDYERQTSPLREQAKMVLNDIIRQCR